MGFLHFSSFQTVRELHTINKSPSLISFSVPADASWLTDREKAFVQARLPTNSPRAAEANFSLKELITTLKDHKVWLFLLCWAFYTVGTTGLQFYQPTVIANLGFGYSNFLSQKSVVLISSRTIAQAQLLNIPAAVFSIILTIIFGVFANTGRIPQPAIPLGFMIIILACYSVLYNFPNTGGVYAATMIAGGFSTAW